MNVFLIETPYQLLNALEAKHTMQLEDSCLVVVLSDQFPQSCYSVLGQEESWTAIHYIPQEIFDQGTLHQKLKSYKSARVRGYFCHYERFLLRRSLNKIALAIGKVENLFLGNYWVDYFRHFANVLNHQKLYLLDDGTQTLQINNYRRESRPLDKGPAWERMKLGLIRALFGMKTRQSPKVTFFTIYNLTTKEGDEIIKHNYSYFRSLVSNCIPSESVFFLGSALTLEGLSHERYFDHFQKVLQYFSGEKVVYVKHPNEDPEQLEYIEKKLGIPVTSFGVPIEYQLICKRTVPKILASFCSSALENCRIIFGDSLKIKSFYMAPEEFSINSNLIRDIYSYYESNSSPTFEVIRL